VRQETFPKRIGYDWSGEVVSSGPGVTGLAVGDSVYGMINSWAAGACATYAIVRTAELARKPGSLSWEEAAAIPLAGQTALQALHDIAEVVAGSRLLITGASGGVGTFAVPIAKAFGAHVSPSAARATSSSFAPWARTKSSIMRRPIYECSQALCNAHFQASTAVLFLGSNFGRAWINAEVRNHRFVFGVELALTPTVCVAAVALSVWCHCGLAIRTAGPTGRRGCPRAPTADRTQERK
jgi:hypothetical protein